MSTTRKIEGYLTAHDDNGPGYELGNGAGFGSFWEGDATKFLPDALPVTLITGKALTEEEHEAEFRRRARAMLKEIIDAREAVRNSPEGMVWATLRQDIEKLAARHGIQLP